MRIIVDAETFLFRCIAGAEYETEWAPDKWTYEVDLSQAKDAFDQEMARIEDIIPQTPLILAFGDISNFRYAVYPQYKANRRKQRRPAGFSALKDWARSAWVSHSFPGIEGDDVVGIMAGGRDIIVSRDKDLKTLPGMHLNGDELETISQEQADMAFFTQVLTGDTTDGYPGCPKIGPKRAAQILDGCKSEKEFWTAVVVAYEDAGSNAETALQMARCARILRRGEYDAEKERPLLWEPPSL
jgi:DNA polymerase-1